MIAGGDEMHFLVHVVQRYVVDYCIVVKVRRGHIFDSAERFVLKLSVEALDACVVMMQRSS